MGNKYAYTAKFGYIEILKEIAHPSSDGNLRKWKILQVNSGKIFWLKASSILLDEEMYECESDCFCSELAGLLGIDYKIDYYMDYLILDRNRIKVCVSEDFDFSSTLTYIDILPFISKYNGVDKFNLVVNALPSVKDELYKILIFDILVANTDRHLNNIVYVKDTDRLLLFDNGASLLSSTSNRLLKNSLSISFEYQKCRPFYDTVGKQIELVPYCNLNKITYKQLYALLLKHIPKKRIKSIAKLLYRNFMKVGEKFEIDLLRE